MDELVHALSVVEGVVAIIDDMPYACAELRACAAALRWVAGVLDAVTRGM